MSTNAEEPVTRLCLAGQQHFDIVNAGRVAAKQRLKAVVDILLGDFSTPAVLLPEPQ